MGRGAGRADRRAAGGGVPAQGRRRAAGADREPAPDAVRGAPLRVLLGGSAADRADRRRLRARAPVRRRRRDGEALRRERLGDRAQHGRRAGGGAGAARALPGAVRGDRAGGAAVGRHVLLQPGRRRDDVRQPPARRGAEGRMGLRGPRDVRLVGGVGHGRAGACGDRSADAGAGRAVGLRAGRGGAGGAGAGVRGRREGRAGARAGRARGCPCRRSAILPPPMRRRSRRLLREAAAASFVLARNAGSLLPLYGGSLRRVAVLGPNAAVARTLGGGSATVFPPYTVAPLDGLRAALGDGVEVVHEGGVRAATRNSVAAPELLRLPGDGGAGRAPRSASSTPTGRSSAASGGWAAGSRGTSTSATGSTRRAWRPSRSARAWSRRRPAST